MNNREKSKEEVKEILRLQKDYFNTQITKDINFRINQLKKLKQGIKKYEEKLLEAINNDLGKHKCEGYITEIGFVYCSITYAIKNIKKWARIKRKLTPIYLMPARSYVINEPYGTVLIIGPYNYPVQLLIEPLIGAISAGNTAVVKPSELSPNVLRVINEMIEEIFDERYIKCIEGGIETNISLLKVKFDYIFFTGSVQVGKIVMKYAAENLVPVTLELGGKSPVIIDESANIKEAARRIIWGKSLNAGQTCVAPDYVVVHEDVKDELIKEMKTSIKKYFGDDIEKSSDFGRIINEKHFNRIKNIIDGDREYIIFGGSTNEKDKYVEFTLLDINSMKVKSMEEEIFGPILPIITYRNLDEIIIEIKNQPKPLALYLFTRNKKVERKILMEISSGNVSINDTISHIANSYIPFGGVENSGIGSYHGRHSFNTFSHERGVLKKPASINNTIAYPPFTERKLKFIKRFLK